MGEKEIDQIIAEGLGAGTKVAGALFGGLYDRIEPVLTQIWDREVVHRLFTLRISKAHVRYGRRMLQAA